MAESKQQRKDVEDEHCLRARESSEQEGTRSKRRNTVRAWVMDAQFSVKTMILVLTDEEQASNECSGNSRVR